VLVTGAAGFIGRHLLSSLPAEWEAVGVVRGEPPSASEREGISWLVADVTHPGFERRLPADVDAVVHLAQSRFDRAFPEGALDVVDVNVGATARLLEYARACAAGQFVLASTATVYRPRRRPLDEDAELDCSSFYAASKRSAEVLARSYSEFYSCWILRIFTTYGAGQRGRLVAELVERVRAGRPVSVAGKEGLLLSPIHVTNVAEALLSAAGRRLPDGHGYEVVNVGGEETLSIRAIAEEIGAALARRPLLEHVEGREPAGWAADRSKLVQLLRVPRPLHFAEGIRRTVRDDYESGTLPTGGSA
jgi:nucleoside-diphosphate-sugar epimerase